MKVPVCLTCCCGAVDIRKGAVVTGLVCIVVSVILYVLVLLGMAFWDKFREEIFPHHYDFSSLTTDDKHFTAIVLDALWWRNFALSIAAVVYIILSNVMLTGALKNRPTMMRTWIYVTHIFLPLFVIIVVLDLVLAIIGRTTLFPLIPGIVGLIVCVFWVYGYLCVISARKVLRNPAKYRKKELRKVIHAESASTPI